MKNVKLSSLDVAILLNVSDREINDAIDSWFSEIIWMHNYNPDSLVNEWYVRSEESGYVFGLNLLQPIGAYLNTIYPNITTRVNRLQWMLSEAVITPLDLAILFNKSSKSIDTAIDSCYNGSNTEYLLTKTTDIGYILDIDMLQCVGNNLGINKQVYELIQIWSENYGQQQS